jgi:hypothetical protein
MSLINQVIGSKRVESVFGMICLVLMFVMSTMFAMRTFAGCILMEPFNVVGERNVGFHKFSSLRNTLILVFERRSCMFVTLLDTSCNVVGDQFHKCIG